VTAAGHVETAPRRRAWRLASGSDALQRGFVTTYLTVLVLIPIAALVVRSTEDGWSGFWDVVTNPMALDALRVTLIAAVAVAAINAVMGTLIAWVLVRDEFPGKNVVNSLIDLPFALPTIVAGLVLIALYGETGVLGIKGISFTMIGVVLALLFVTLPFVIRAVQPTLMELDTEMEEAAASLGAKPLTIVRKIILPNLAPAILTGTALAFARAVGEFGSLVLISGNIPGETQVASLYIFSRIESGDISGATAVSVVLLLISVGILFAFHVVNRWSTRHGRHD
jgi:sulfate/thiosulfate transport system permease protein